MLFSRLKRQLPTPDEAHPGHPERPFPVPSTHAVLGTPLDGPVPAGHEVAVFGLGCFWGAERLFWELPGVYTTAVGYAGGISPNPTYDEVCSGRTGHTEAVRVVYDPAVISYRDLLKAFWEGHDSTQGFRQGNDVGTQYRSAVYWTTEAQRAALEATQASFQRVLDGARRGAITTETGPAREFFLAEDYHQQYLYKVPNGYCGLGGTGLSCPVGVATTDA